MNAHEYDGVDAVDADLALAPQRTSVLAILSLICAVICIIPGAGLLAIIFGVSALVGINASRGRVGGTGLAVSGLVLGLVVTLLWGAVTFGAFQVLNMFGTYLTQPTSQAMTALEAGDFQKARSMLDPKIAARLTEDDLKRFRAAYQAEMGAFKSIPEGWDIFAAYGQLGPIMSKVQGQQQARNAIPLPASFEKGTAVLLLEIDQKATPRQGPPKPGELIPVRNITLFLPSGAVVDLLTSTPAPAAPPAAPVDPGAPAPPAEENPGGK